MLVATPSRFPFLEDAPSSLARPPPPSSKGRLRQLATSLRTSFRDLSHLICVHIYYDFLFVLFPFLSFMFLYSYNSLDVFVFGVSVSLSYACL